MNHRDALNLLDQVGANFEGKRQDHINIQQAIMTLRVFIEEHDPLDPGAGAPSIPANENQEKKVKKTSEEIAAEVRVKGEK
jgi:hypothetical protein